MELKKVISNIATMELLQVSITVFVIFYLALTEALDIWNDYKINHNKVYSPEEDVVRESLFYQKLSEISDHNLRFLKKAESYKKGLNQFSDMTPEELQRFRNPHLLKQKELVSQTRTIIDPLMFLLEAIPDAVNWVERGAVTPVKDQGRCNSCYAFAATVVLEAQHYFRTGFLRNISEQQFVDCSLENWGCEGGFTWSCLEYAMDKGVMFQEDYKYTGRVAKCHIQPERMIFPLSDFYRIPEGDEDTMTRLIALTGPVAVSLDDHHMHDYSGGILSNSHGCTDINHAIALVGYGTDNETGQEYYIAKNSWGDRWGEGGYLRIARGVNYCFLGELGVAAVNKSPSQ